jgi:hypothetical protein
MSAHVGAVRDERLDAATGSPRCCADRGRRRIFLQRREEGPPRRAASRRHRAVQPHAAPTRQSGDRDRRKGTRLIVITDEQSHDTVPAPKGKGYMINVASYRNGVGAGDWTRVDGFSESVIDWIIAQEK